MHHNDFSSGEPSTEQRRPVVVQLDGDDRSTPLQESGGDPSIARADIDDELAGSDVGGIDQSCDPPAIELVPPPAPGVRGHGAPSPSSWRQPSPDGFGPATEFGRWMNDTGSSKSDEAKAPSVLPFAGDRSRHEGLDMGARAALSGLRLRCQSCASTSVVELVRVNTLRWRELLDDGLVTPGRPNDSKWSSLEYACHVRDVYRRYDQRIELMLTGPDPLFENWDQDLSAVEDRYDEQDPSQVIDELRLAADVLADRLERVADEEWARPGCRSDGAMFTVGTIVRYMIHDPIHHVWDVTGLTA
jgi:hypothetical protein